ncbi:laccase [Lineolata rhizophorae]|uniref:laccase n=1 Tax=Lineolata rhizophorae TaxID=578093 RepID=A0A6A6P970_9PEZI|nr:laccase [Lineolata rhizophorae]
MDDGCRNGPLSRGCWNDGFSINTDFDVDWPDTGNVVQYTLDITNTTCSPDGGPERLCFLVNNQSPGPTIYADWGDTLQITVNNQLQHNGTSIHWHGIRQYLSNLDDGTNGITECPIAPTDSKTYTFKCTQFGTAWYHSHYSAQYGDGITGGLVINGPTTANYDVDLGTYFISDWYYDTAFQVEDQAADNLQNRAPAPPGDNILINGTNKNPDGGGAYDVVQLQQGYKYMLRLINGAVDNNIRVSLDNHKLKVITNDLVPIVPFTTDWLLIAIGQRYEVIIETDQPIDNYWFRAEVANACASGNKFYGRSIFRYDGAPDSDPTSIGTDAPGGCEDPQSEPYVPTEVPKEPFAEQLGYLMVDLAVEQVTTNQENIVVWAVNMTAIDIDWDKPTAQYVKEGNESYPRTYNLIEVPRAAAWLYWIIQEVEGTPIPVPHPMHLHGHDFYILGTGTGTFDINTSIDQLKFDNPPRRDVALLPGRGWMAIAFQSDNPGSWLLHCHIAWHISEGLGVQFLESKEKMPLPDGEWERVCTNWETYFNDYSIYPKQDSGL